MSFLADESVDRPVVERLRQDGWSVTYVAELAPGISDDEVLDEANAQDAILITADKDFGELVYRLGRISGGVILLRLAGLTVAMKAEVVSTIVRDRASEMQNAFTVVAPGQCGFGARTSSSCACPPVHHSDQRSTSSAVSEARTTR